MHGVTVWFTGLSASGKTTVSRRVEEILNSMDVPVERLDGDVIRQGLTRDLGFSKEDRTRNIERVTFVAKLLTRNGVVCLAAFVSPYEEIREYSRREIGEFLEVFVTAPLEVLVERDIKGLYKKALAGEIQNFTGVNDPFEVPEHPDLTLETHLHSVEECAQMVVELLRGRGYIAGDAAGATEARPKATARTETPGAAVPHGGELVNRELQGAARDAAIERARHLPVLRLDERELADLGMIGTGAMSPLTGFMTRKDYETVVEKMHLMDGLVWTLPVTLAVTPEQADGLREGQEVALSDQSGTIHAIMQVQEKYAYDKKREAQMVYGTDDAAHPGVARLYAQPDILVGGPLWVMERPNPDAFPQYQLTPFETRQEFHRRGWRTIVAFQTRNPIHRAHEYLIKAALESVDGALIHPLLGATKSDDVPAAIRVRAYEELVQRYFQPGRVVLSGFPAAMRYAGPREAVFHAICRKNYGCTHFIVGRDHAGVGSYYGTYAAQELISSFRPEELGIIPVKFDHAFFCRACNSMGTTKTCPHDASEHVVLSGTKVREMLSAGEFPPAEFMRPEIAQVLTDAYRARSQAD